MFKYIINSKTNKKVLSNSKIGKSIITNYLKMIGGMNATLKKRKKKDDIEVEKKDSSKKKYKSNTRIANEYKLVFFNNNDKNKWENKYIDIIEKTPILKYEISEFNATDILKTNYDYVVNASGHKDNKNTAAEKIDIKKTHFFALINLVNIFLNRKIRKFIQIGSSAEYGIAPAPQKETFDFKPISTYGEAKLASTQLLQILYKTQLFPATILRPFQVYGPNQGVNKIIPEVIYTKQSSQKEILMGLRAIVKLDDIYLFPLMYYRINDAAIVGFGMEKDNIQANISYDINTSDLTQASKYRSGFEFSVIYVWKKKDKKIEIIEQKCPKYL